MNRNSAMKASVEQENCTNFEGCEGAVEIVE